MFVHSVTSIVIGVVVMNGLSLGPQHPSPVSFDPLNSINSGSHVAAVATSVNVQEPTPPNDMFQTGGDPEQDSVIVTGSSAQIPASPDQILPANSLISSTSIGSEHVVQLGSVTVATKNFGIGLAQHGGTDVPH